MAEAAAHLLQNPQGGQVAEHDPTSEIMELQMGPSHPATHGTIKFNLTLDGEKIPQLRCRDRLSAPRL